MITDTRLWLDLKDAAMLKALPSAADIPPEILRTTNLQLNLVCWGRPNDVCRWEWVSTIVNKMPRLQSISIRFNLALGAPRGKMEVHILQFRSWLPVEKLKQVEVHPCTQNKMHDFEYESPGVRYY